MCRRVNEESEGFRDVACNESAVLVVLIVPGPRGVKAPDHVMSEHTEVRGWRCAGTPSEREESQQGKG